MNNVITLITAIRMANFNMGISKSRLVIQARRAGKSSMYRTIMMRMYQRINDINTGDVMSTPYLTEIPQRCKDDYTVQGFRKSLSNLSTERNNHENI